MWVSEWSTKEISHAKEHLVWLIPHVKKHEVWHQNQVSSMFRTKLIISLLEDVLGLLQSLNPVLDLQNDLRLTQMVPYDSPWFPMPKNMGFDTKIKCQIQINNFTPWRGPWPPTVPPPISWPSDQSEAHENGPTWFPMVPHAKEHGVWHQNQVSIAWPEIFDTLWKTCGEPNSTRLSRVFLFGAPVWATRDSHFWIPH